MSEDIDGLLGRISTLHYYSARNSDYVGSAGRDVFYRIENHTGSFRLPLRWLDLFSFSRSLTRVFRLDRINIINISDTGIVVLRQNAIYRFTFATGTYSQVLYLPNTRNILMGGACVGVNGTEILFGDYGGSKTIKKIYRSKDDGCSWEVCHKYELGEVKQVLNISWDHYSSCYYITTGDEAGQCKISVFDKTMEHIETIGDGSLKFRAISITFFKKEILWVTNDPYSGSIVYALDRLTRSIICKTPVSGSVWYSKELQDGRYLMSTCAENIEGANARIVRVYLSDNYEEWREICRFIKDSYPKFPFRFGLVSFPQGDYGLDDTFINAEAVKNYDGSVLKLAEFASNV